MLNASGGARSPASRGQLALALLSGVGSFAIFRVVAVPIGAITQDSPRMRTAVEDDLLRTLETTPPSFLVDVGDDARGRVVPTSPLAPAHARFQRLLAAKYDLALASGGYRLYRVRP